MNNHPEQLKTIEEIYDEVREWMTQQIQLGQRVINLYPAQTEVELKRILGDVLPTYSFITSEGKIDYGLRKDKRGGYFELFDLIGEGAFDRNLYDKQP